MATLPMSDSESAKERGGGAARLLSFMFATWLFLQQPMNMLRLSGAVIPNAFDIWKILYWCLFLFMVASVVIGCASGIMRKERKHGINSLVFFACLYFLYVVCIGLLRGGGRDVLVDAVQFYLIGPAIFYAAVSNPGSDSWLFSRKLMVGVLIVHVFAVLVFYLFLIGSVYPGFGTQSLAFAAVFFAKSGAWGVVCLAMILVILEGKRGTLLALLFGLIWSASVLNRGVLREAVFKTLIMLATLGALAIAGFSALAAVGSGDSAVINRLQFINPFSSSFDLYVGSSGRAGEIVSAFGELVKEDIGVLAGTGTGYRYEWDLGYATDADYETNKGYVHASYVNYFIHGGIIVGSAFFLFLTYCCLYKGWGSRWKLGNPRMQLAAAMCATSWMQSWFGFGTASDPLFWGILAAVFLALREVKIGRKNSLPSAQVTDSKFLR